MYRYFTLYKNYEFVNYICIIFCKIFLQDNVYNTMSILYIIYIKMIINKILHVNKNNEILNLMFEKKIV